MKNCRKCGQDKPLAEFPLSQFRKDGTRQGDGHRAVCKKCDNAYSRERKKAMSKTEEASRRKYHADYCRRYRRRKPWVGKDRTANTRAGQLGLGGRITQRDVLEAWQQWDGCCWVCGSAAEELDHFRPINHEAGGTNTADNIRPICRDCNHKRSHRWHGENTAMTEAGLLKKLKQMLG